MSNRKRPPARCEGCGGTRGVLGTIAIEQGGKRLLIHSCEGCWSNLVAAAYALAAEINVGGQRQGLDG